MPIKVVWVEALLALSCLTGAFASANSNGAPPPTEFDLKQRYASYKLGAEDQIAVQVVDVPEIPEKPVRVGPNGFISLPMIGQMKAGGLTTSQLETAIKDRLQAYVLYPQVSVSIADFGSQPVSVIGAVNNPGVQQLRGARTIVEVLSMCGGLRADAGNTIRITRQLRFGRIPMPDATNDPSAGVSIAAIPTSSVLRGTQPTRNITIRPYDVVSVSPADLVYVLGDVGKAGGFVLNDRESISVLQAIALAGGVTATAAPNRARLLRASLQASARTELTINLKKMLSGSAPDLSMGPNDILFVPKSHGKAISLRAAEAAIQMGTGFVIWH